MAYDNADGIDNNCEYVIEGRQLLTNITSVYLRYVALPQTTTDLDSLAASAVICVLAIKLSTPLQLDNKLSVSLINELNEVILPQARSIDTFENQSWSNEQSNWMSSRYYQSPIT